MSVIYKYLLEIKQYDMYTYLHSNRVGINSEFIGYCMGLERQELKELIVASHLHDIGKLKIPKNILCKPGELNKKEWDIIRHHPELAADIINDAGFNTEIQKAVMSHHERWDGAGYPNGLSGGNIPLYARIICIADSLDAMISYRSYRQPIELNSAMQELYKCSDQQFDPYIIQKVRKEKRKHHIFRGYQKMSG